MSVRNNLVYVITFLTTVSGSEINATFVTSTSVPCWNHEISGSVSASISGNTLSYDSRYASEVTHTV